MKNKKDIIKTIYFFVKKYKFSIFMYIFIGFLIIDFTELIFKSYIYQIIIDKFTSNTFFFKGDFYIFIIFVITCNTWPLFTALVKKFEYNLDINLKESIKNYYFQKILKNSLSFFNSNMSGTLNSKIQKVSNNIVSLVYNCGAIFSISIITIITVIIFIKINYILSFCLFCWFIIYMFGYLYFSKKIAKKVEEGTKIENQLNGKIIDSLTNNFNLKLFTKEKYEKAQIKKESIKYKKIISKYTLISTFSMIFDFLSITIFLLISFYISINMFLKKEITLGELTFITTILNSIVWWLRQIIKEFIRAIEQYTELSESLSVIEEKPEIQDSKNSKNIILNNPPIIELKDLYFRYKENLSYVFDKLNLKINSKQKIGIVGYSGAGKSTLINLLLRFYDITSGSILIDKNNIKEDFTQLSLRKNITYIPQDPILFHRSIKENILYGKTNATDEELIEATKKAQCFDFIDSLENKFDTLVGERGVKLSGGQRQRITIARAILKNSPILILDEATSALDSITEREIQIALTNLMENKTVIVVAHRLSTLNNMDRIIVLDKGQIVEDGSKNYLLNIDDGLFRKMWDMQKDGVILE